VGGRAVRRHVENRVKDIGPQDHPPYSDAGLHPSSSPPRRTLAPAQVANVVARGVRGYQISNIAQGKCRRHKRLEMKTR